MRIKIAGRFKPCVHMGCFDLEVFVEMNQRSRKVSYLIGNLFPMFHKCLFFMCTELTRKSCGSYVSSLRNFNLRSSLTLLLMLQWQCPICLKNYSWETIIIDPYFNRITSKVLSCILIYHIFCHS